MPGEGSKKRLSVSGMIETLAGGVNMWLPWLFSRFKNISFSLAYFPRSL